jgi:hypothetical protein
MPFIRLTCKSNHPTANGCLFYVNTDHIVQIWPGTTAQGGSYVDLTNGEEATWVEESPEVVMARIRGPQ